MAVHMCTPDTENCADLLLDDGRVVGACVVRTSPDLFKLWVQRIIKENQSILDRLALDD